MRPALPVVVLACLCAPARAGELLVRVTGADDKPLADAVVVAFPAVARSEPPRPRSATEDQVDREFVPYVQPIRAGTAVNFPNNDDIRHHVYSFSPAKTFELALYAGTPAAPVVFDKVGVVKLGCNIHDWMIAYLYVTDAPYFGKTSAQGTVELRDLPAGSYTVKVWHPRLPGSEDATARRLDVRDDAPSAAQWKLKLKREFRPRRMPASGDTGYR